MPRERSRHAGAGDQLEERQPLCYLIRRRPDAISSGISQNEILSDLPVDRETLPPGPRVACNRQGLRLERDMTGLKKGGCVSLPELNREVLG